MKSIDFVQHVLLRSRTAWSSALPGDAIARNGSSNVGSGPEADGGLLRRGRAPDARSPEARLFAPLPFDQMILAATSLVHGLAHLIIRGATEAKSADAEHAMQLAREVTAIFGAGLLPRDPPKLA